MRHPFLLAAMAACVLMFGCGAPATETTEAPGAEMATAEPEAAAEVRHDVVYACACGPECTCNSLATTAGTCTCGTELGWTHLVKVEGNEGLLCTCAEGCSCEIDASDPTKCSCGGELRRVSFEGTGLYYCNCGGSCTCNFVSSEPGNCSCGMELTSST